MKNYGWLRLVSLALFIAACFAWPYRSPVRAEDLDPEFLIVGGGDLRGFVASGLVILGIGVVLFVTRKRRRGDKRTDMRASARSGRK